MTTHRAIPSSAFERALFFYCVVTGLGATAGAAEIEVTGRVVDEHGSPLSSIEMTLEELPARAEAARAALGDPSARAVFARASTDEDGQFVLPAKPGVWRVAAATGESRIARAWVAGALFGSVRLPTVSLASDEGFVVEVRDERGQPVSGAWAQVWNQAPRERKAEGWQPVEMWSQTDGRGRARLAWNGRAGATFEVRVPRAGPDGLPAGWHGVRRSIHQGGRVTMPPTRLARLRAVRDRQPQAGALFETRSGSVAVADADGVVEVMSSDEDGFLIGSFLLPEGAFEWSGLAASDGPPTVVELPPPARAVTGRVLDAAGEPLAGVAVSTTTLPRQLRRHAWTDERGEYRLALPHKDLHLKAAAAGYRAATFQVVAGASRLDDVRLQAAAAVAGRLIDEQERPVPAARVRVYRSSDSQWQLEERELASTSDRQGRFAVTGLDPGAAYQLRFEAAGLKPEVAQVTAGAEPAAPREWTLARGVRITGRAMHARDPVAGARLKLSPVGSETALPQSQRRGARYATSGADGSFVFSGIEAGAYELEMRAEGRPLLRREGITAGATGDLDLGELGMATGTSVSGRVVGVDGSSIEGAQIISIQSRFRSTFSDSDGRFRVHGVPAEGPAHILVSADGWNAVTYPLRGPVPLRIQIVLKPMIRVSGRLLDRSGRPVYGARLGASLRTTDRGAPKTVHPRVTGSTFFVRLPEPGVLSLRGKAPGPPLVKPRTVDVGAPVDGVDLVFDPD